jgi:hypothetical protein
MQATRNRGRRRRRRRRVQGKGEVRQERRRKVTKYIEDLREMRYIERCVYEVGAVCVSVPWNSYIVMVKARPL